MINKELTNNNLVSKSFRSYLLVTIIGLIAGSIGMVVDGLVIGNFLGTEAMAAYGISNPLTMLLTAITMIFANGGTILISHYIGRGDKEKLNQCFTITIVISLIVSLLISLSSSIYVNSLAVILGAKGPLIHLTSDYMLGLLLGTVPLVISQVLFYIIRLDASPILPLISVTVLTIVNVVLDLLFVNVFHLSIFYVGIATSISYAVCIIVFLPYFRKKDAFKFSKIKNFKESLNILNTGLPSSLNRIYTTLRVYVTNNLAILFGGTIAMGALAIQSNINLVLSTLALGIGMTTTLLTGVFFGEQDKRALKDTLYVSIKFGLIFITLIMVIVLIFSPFIVTAFGKSPEIYKTATFSLRLLALSLPPSLICVIFLNYYSATKNSFYANYIGFAHSFLFMSLFGGILSTFVGINGVWLCFLLGEVFTLIGLFVLIRIKEGIWPKELKDFLLLKEDFEENIIANFSISLDNNLDSTIGLSNEISKYGEKYPNKKYIINKLALCVEEMASNIIKHGFYQNEKKYIDIRIIFTKEDIIFRIRDNGKSFNPVEYGDSNEFSEKSVGIKMIQEISKTMEYRNTIGLNNLTITL